MSTGDVEAKPRAGRWFKGAAYSKLFDDPDQDRIRDELSTFFGPRAQAFLHTYEKMRANKSAGRGGGLTWCWPAAIGSFVWFFYRRLYVSGAVLIFAPLVLSYLFGSTGGGGASAAMAVLAKGQYVNLALERISKADQLGLTGAERLDYLRRAGGVSLPAGIFAGFIYAILLAAVIFAIFHPGH